MHTSINPLIGTYTVHYLPMPLTHPRTPPQMYRNRHSIVFNSSHDLCTLRDRKHFPFVFPRPLQLPSSPPPPTRLQVSRYLRCLPCPALPPPPHQQQLHHMQLFFTGKTLYKNSTGAECPSEHSRDSYTVMCLN